MTHNFKTGATYKTRIGQRAWFIGCKPDSYNGDHPLVFMVGDSVFTYREDGKSAGWSELDIIGTWEESPEEIDVANMWVAIKRDDAGCVIECHAGIYAPTLPRKFDKDIIAIIRVFEWEAIKRGERKLKVGEGL